MTLSFYEDFPVKYSCAANNLITRGYRIVASGSNCTVDDSHIFKLKTLPNDGRPRLPLKANPLYGLVEGRMMERVSHGSPLFATVGKMYGITIKTVHSFNDSISGAGDQEDIIEVDSSSLQKYAFHLGRFFRLTMFKREVIDCDFKFLASKSLVLAQILEAIKQQSSSIY